MKKFILLIALLLITFGLLNPIYNATSDPPLNDNVVDEVISIDGSKSVLKVVHRFEKDNLLVTKTGSAVIIESDDEYYYAVTNYHLMIKDDFQSIELQITDYLNNTFDGESLVQNNAQSIISSFYDLCIIRFQRNDIELPIATIRGLALTHTELLTAIGYPNGERIVTNGYLSDYIRLDLYPFEVIEHSVPITHGNSGGGLFDSSGKLVGIIMAGVFDESNVLITGYAIPVKDLQDYLELFI